MSGESPMSREEALKLGAEHYRQHLNNRLVETQTRKERAQEAAHIREEGRLKEAKSFLADLNWRANFRDRVRLAEQKEKETQAEFLKRQADVYRRKLKRYLCHLEPDKFIDEPGLPLNDNE